MQEKRRNIIAILALLVLYFGTVVFLIRSSVDIDQSVAVVLSFYAGIGFELDVYVVRIIIFSLFFSCLAHVSLVVVHSVSKGWPEISESSARSIVYCLFRVILAIGFCILVVGALGENISSKEMPVRNKEFSVLIGGLVLGGVVWMINDFVGVFYNKFVRRLK